MIHGGLQWINGKPNTYIKDFSVNLNPLGVPNFIKELLEDAIRKEVYRFYPDDYKYLKSVIAEVFNVNPSYVGVFNGSTQVLRLLDPMVVPEPNFSEYKRIDSYYAEEKKEEFIYRLDKRYPKIIASNPNNPTGSCIPLSDVIDYLSDKSHYLVLDEAYIDISFCSSSKTLIEEYKNLLIVSTFTKSFAVPGLRLGFAIGKDANKLESLAYPWRIDSITYYAFSSLDPKEIKSYFSGSKAKVYSLIRKYWDVLKGVKKYKTTAPFMLVEFKKPSRIINSILYKHDITIRLPDGFRGLRETHARLALRDDIEALYDMLVMENLI